MLAAAAGTVLFAGLGPILGAARAQVGTTASPPLTYFGIYLRAAKLGYAIVTRDDHAIYKGRTTVKSEMRMVMNITVMGSSNKIVTTDTSWTDPKTGAPVAEIDTTESSGRTTKVTCAYSDTSVAYIADINGVTRADTLTLPPGKHFRADPTNCSDIKLSVNLKATGEVFVPESFKLVDSELDVVDTVALTVEGKQVSAFKIIDHNPMEDSTLYADADGNLLRIDNSVAGIPMQVRREPRELAMAPAAGATAMPDLISLTSNRPTGESLVGARTARSITYNLGGVTRKLPDNDSVESVTTPVTGQSQSPVHNEIITVHATPLPDSATAPMVFPTPGQAPAALQPFLLPTPYVDSSQTVFHDVARRVLGSGPTDCVTAAQKISAYVYKTMTPDAGIAALRTATDVCNDPRGVCRDYTALFAAIARAAGLPTKQCFGVAFDGEAFVGHAWPEVWVGKTATGADNWIAIEPTWGRPYADATHLKLAEGELTDFFTVASDLTKYKIDVVKVE